MSRNPAEPPELSDSSRGNPVLPIILVSLSGVVIAAGFATILLA